jgi:hypothetical protein
MSPECSGPGHRAAVPETGEFKSASGKADLCVVAAKERKMHFHFYLGLGLVLILMGLCFFYRRENK